MRRRVTVKEGERREEEEGGGGGSSAKSTRHRLDSHLVAGEPMSMLFTA